MKKNILFDMDNTLVRGHLVYYFVRSLMVRHPSMWLSFIPFCLYALSMRLYLLPRLLNRVRKTNNLALLDRGMRLYVARLYQHLYAALAAVDLQGQQLDKKIKELVCTKRMLKRFYPKAVSVLKRHVARKNEQVVIISASLEEILVPCVRWLCENYEISFEKIHVIGTYCKKGLVDVCLGSNKVRRLVKTISSTQRNQVYRGGFPFHTLYTDNGFLADLPLLIHCEQPIVISPSQQLLRLVPEKVRIVLQSYSSWEQVLTL